MSDILTRLRAAVNRGLSPRAAVETVLPGCQTVSYWTKRLADSDLNKSKKKRKSKKRRRTTVRPSKRSQFYHQQTALHRATLETVERVNRESTELDGVADDPQGGYVVRVNGQEVSWADDEAEAVEAYHSVTGEPRQIDWFVGGQRRVLEVW